MVIAGDETAETVPEGAGSGLGVVAAMLADHAQVRDGLLFVCGGGISQVAFGSFPGILVASLALVVEVAHPRAAGEHQVAVVVHDPGGAMIGGQSGGIVVPDPAEIGMPLCAVFALNGVAIPRPGRWQVSVGIDGALAATIWFGALEAG